MRKPLRAASNIYDRTYSGTNILMMEDDIVMTKYNDTHHRLAQFNIGTKRGTCGIIELDRHAGFYEYPLRELRFVTRHPDALEDPEEILP
jgi:hypothetical protein